MSEATRGPNLVDLTWKESYRCGHGLIDTPHDGLFRLAKDLINAYIFSTPDKGAITGLIDDLLARLKTHFADEAEVLAVTSCPCKNAHIHEHDRLLDRARVLRDTFAKDSLTRGERIEFIAHDVVAKHLLVADTDEVRVSC